MFGLGCTLVAGAAAAHGGGLDAEGCHTNHKTGEYHCHRGGGKNAPRPNPGSNYEAAKSASSFVRTPSASSGPTCFTGPRGGTYTITASGRKNYGGC
ncbi:YHYH domain-containing protein [Cupriavidus necator]|nr:YHYH domain-containing protein [Cupriavidus necator]